MANIVTGNHIPSFHAAQGVMKFDTAAVTFTESAALDTFYATTATAAQLIAIKDINFSPPKSVPEIVHLLGTETVTVGAGVPAGGTFQNAMFDDKAYGEAVLTCTMILVGDPTNMPDLLQLACGSGIAISTTHKRYTFGASDTNETRNLSGSIMINCENGTEEYNAVLNNPYVDVGDIKPTSMDGHFEVSFEARSLPKNCAVEQKI